MNVSSAYSIDNIQFGRSIWLKFKWGCKRFAQHWEQFLASYRGTRRSAGVSAVAAWEIIPDGVTLAHKFFEYIPTKRRYEILPRLKNRSAQIFLVRKNGKEKCAFIAVLNPDGVHLQEIGGDFVFEMQKIAHYLEITAVVYKKKRVTFCAENNTIKAIGERLGYKKYYSDNEKEEFEKVM